MRCLVTILFAALLSPIAIAEPVTYSSVIAPTFSQPSTGTPEGYRLYQGCDVGLQSVGALIDGVYTSGKAYSFAGDTDTPPTLCIVAFNAAGEGGFDTAFTLTTAPAVPGPVQNLVPGDCQAVAGSANEYTCTFTIVTQ